MPSVRGHLLRDRISIRGVAAATCVVVASTGLTVAVHAVASEPDRQTATPAARVVTRIGELPAEASVRRSTVPAGKRLAAIKAANRREKLRAAREARAARDLRAEREERAERASRSSARVTSSGSARGVAASIARSRYGWGAEQFSCLDSLWERESGWNVHAANPSGAYGIPQALPGSKMGAFGGDWRDSATTQIEWGLDYIDGRYGNPCGAWSAFGAKGWY